MVRIVAKDDHIELVIEGLPEDEGRVRVNTFVTALQKFSGALQKIDRETNDGATGSVFEIAALSYASPVRVSLRARPTQTMSDPGQRIIKRLEIVANALVSGASLSGFDAELLEDIRGLSAPVGKTLKNATLIFNGAVVDLTPRITQRVDEALAVEDECAGSLEGHLDQINIHQGANTFHIYPVVGPTRVTCHFPSSLFDDAVAAVGKRVEVFGTLKYRAQAPFPHQIAVTGIETFPPDHELPEWEDLRGRAPDATGALSSDAFVRELRDAWD